MFSVLIVFTIYSVTCCTFAHCNILAHIACDNGNVAVSNSIGVSGVESVFVNVCGVRSERLQERMEWVSEPS